MAEPRSGPQDAGPQGGGAAEGLPPIRASCNGSCARSPRRSLVYDEARQELISRAARMAFPIREGIPMMLHEEARRSTTTSCAPWAGAERRVPPATSGLWSACISGASQF